MYTYLDIETTGFDYARNKIVSMQLVDIDEYSGHTVGKLEILKEWESNEKSIIETFISMSRINSGNIWDFIPVGYNLNFDLGFIMARCAVHGLSVGNLFARPSLDLRGVGILMNRGQFKGSGLDKLTGKPRDGSAVPIWYENGEFSKIVDYAEVETQEFIKWLVHCYKDLPESLKRFKTQGIDLEAMNALKTR